MKLNDIAQINWLDRNWSWSMDVPNAVWALTLQQLEARTPMACVISDEQCTGQCSGLSVDTTPFSYKYLIEIVWSLHEQVKQRFIIG